MMTDADAANDPATELLQDHQNGELERDAELEALENRIDDLQRKLQDHIAQCNCSATDDAAQAAEDLVKIERIARWSDQELRDLREKSRLKWLAVQIWTELPNHFDLLTDLPGRPRSWRLTRDGVRRAIANIENRPKADIHRWTPRRVLDDDPGWIRRLAASCVDEQDSAEWMTDDARQERDEVLLVPVEEWVSQRPEQTVEVML